MIRLCRCFHLSFFLSTFSFHNFFKSMEMEDHHSHYGMSDLRQLINGRSHFNQPPDHFSSGHHRNIPPSQQFDMTMTMTTMPPAAINFSSGIECENGSVASNGRWPRQETLTLLEIRSRLDHKFKEANQKGPSWDEVSRIMCEEHGYQRSGKKCREKFENLYKYYKKTKEGKAGRQDGKHYRFFRQLEALYGETNNQNSAQENQFISNSIQFQSQKVSESLSLSNSSEFDTSSSNDNDSIKTRKRRGGRSWKGKIKDFIDCQMKKLVEKQELWLEKIMQALEQKEKERLVREEEWRKQEVLRTEREQKFWAKERAWIEARDSALMEALQKFNGKEVENQNQSVKDENPLIYKEKWDKKRKEISRSNCYFESNESLYNQGGGYGEMNDGSSPSSSNVVVQENCFRFLMGDNGENLWENYGVNKMNKDGN